MARTDGVFQVLVRVCKFFYKGLKGKNEIGLAKKIIFDLFFQLKFFFGLHVFVLHVSEHSMSWLDSKVKKRKRRGMSILFQGWRE